MTATAFAPTRLAPRKVSTPAANDTFAPKSSVGSKPVTIADFIGTPSTLTEADYQWAAEQLGCDIASVKTITAVETRGKAFRKSGIPENKPEPHKFSKYTGGRFDATHPHLSEPRYSEAKKLWRKDPEPMLLAMAELDFDAAIEASSWGAYQIMGYHWKALGYESPRAFLTAMKSGALGQIEAFVAYCLANRCDGHLRMQDWHAFGAAYNGAAYMGNDYAGKCQREYRRLTSENGWVILRYGAKSPAVRSLQVALAELGYAVTVDGGFGAETESALREFQAAEGLAVDGIAGTMTWNRLRERQKAQKTIETAPPPPAANEDIIDQAGQVIGVGASAGAAFAGWPWYAVCGFVVGTIVLLIVRQRMKK